MLVLLYWLCWKVLGVNNVMVPLQAGAGCEYYCGATIGQCWGAEFFSPDPDLALISDPANFKKIGTSKLYLICLQGSRSFKFCMQKNIRQLFEFVNI
jgi:hypothetical protein